MIETTGLRARKKARTHDAIADAAISLFLAHGFDRVSVTDIAAAAEVSKPTLFRYFATKVVAFHRLVFSMPSLAGRLTRYMLDDEEALAGALGPGIQARLQAAQVLAVQRVLARANWQKIAAGRTARDVHPEAVADAGQAFAQLRSGTAGPAHDGA